MPIAALNRLRVSTIVKPRAYTWSALKVALAWTAFFFRAPLCLSLPVAAPLRFRFRGGAAPAAAALACFRGLLIEMATRVAAVFERNTAPRIE